MFPIPTVWDVKTAMRIVISVVALAFLGMAVGIYHPSKKNFEMQHSIWREGAESSFFLAQAAGYHEPNWGRLMREVYFPWMANLYVPYFAIPSCCNLPSGEAAFVDSDIEDPEASAFLPGHPEGINEGLSSTTYTSTSSEDADRAAASNMSDMAGTLMDGAGSETAGL